MSYPGDGGATRARRPDDPPADWLALCWLELFALSKEEGPGQLLTEVALMDLADSGVLKIVPTGSGPLLQARDAAAGAVPAARESRPGPWVGDLVLWDLGFAKIRRFDPTPYAGVTVLAALERGWGNEKKVRVRDAGGLLVTSHGLFGKVRVFVPDREHRQRAHRPALELAERWRQFTAAHEALHQLLIAVTRVTPAPIQVVARD
jgi:hypothetical protein